MDRSLHNPPPVGSPEWLAALDHPYPLSHAASSLWLSNAARTDKVGQMNSEQLQGLAVLAMAMVPVAVLWWVWIRMLN